MTIDVGDYTFTSAERDTLRCLFLKGPTWDGNIPSKSGRNSLERRKLAESGKGYAWLTREGVYFAIEIMNLDKSR